jgi:ketosteroid isomerase-like protein
MRGRLPSSIASAVGARTRITIREAVPADCAAVEQLATLAGRRAPSSHLLVGEADGEVVAVVGDDGAVIADPFRVTVDVVELLRVRAGQLRSLAA